jgi:hypothetical protein
MYQWRNMFFTTGKTVVSTAVRRHSSQVVDRATFARDAVEGSKAAFYEHPGQV